MPIAETTTPGGLLLALAVLVPFTGVLVGLVLGGRNAQRVALATIVAGLGIALAIAHAAGEAREPLVYLLGGWSPPLGVALRADGPAVAMMAVVAVVIAGIALYACGDFGTPAGEREARAPYTYWLLLLAVWGSLNLAFVSGDMFTLYVALELVTFAGVPLVCLDGHGETLRAALRYVVYALAGSVFYLLGAVLLYGGYGTLDIALLAQRVRPEPVAWAAAALMTTGLLAKTALFPLHLWLPPAHAGAPPAASAVLSALVVKGSFFIVVRLWFDVMPGVPGIAAAHLLAALGAAAILVGSVVALRQRRLKLLIAYSTLAQIGYLFIMFPLAFDAATSELVRGAVLTGGILQAASHATAKAAMFMAAGLIYAAFGHDRIADLAGAARAAPLSVLAFVLGGLALTGIVPSGAYLAKKLLLDAADGSGQWWWSLILQTGGFFTTGYVVLVLAHALQRSPDPIEPKRPIGRLQEAAALALASCSLLLALAALGPVPGELLAKWLSVEELASTLLTLTGGVAVALLLGRTLPELPVGPTLIATGAPLRRAIVGVGTLFESADGVLRRWPVAGLSLLMLTLLFGAASAALR